MVTLNYIEVIELVRRMFKISRLKSTCDDDVRFVINIMICMICMIRMMRCPILEGVGA